MHDPKIASEKIRKTDINNKFRELILNLLYLIKVYLRKGIIVDEKHVQQATFLKEFLGKIPEASKESQFNEKTNWIPSEQFCNTDSEY